MNSPVLQKSCRSSRYLGGLGALVGCSGMILGAFSGAVGAAATGAARSSSTDSMAGMQNAPSNPGWVNAINTVGQPLLIVSLLLVIVGLWSRGPVPTALAVVGSVFFYVFMFILYSLPLAIVAAMILASAYAVAFLAPALSRRWTLIR